MYIACVTHMAHTRGIERISDSRFKCMPVLVVYRARNGHVGQREILVTPLRESKVKQVPRGCFLCFISVLHIVRARFFAKSKLKRLSIDYPIGSISIVNAANYK